MKCELLDFSKCGVNTEGPQHLALKYEVGDWPWIGSLGYWSNDTWIHLCGTTLINHIYFITAAHCVREENGSLTNSRYTLYYTNFVF